MSKTSVTQLEQLEARLRVRLLNRTTRKVNVTADGAVYYERVVRLLADMDNVHLSPTDMLRDYDVGRITRRPRSSVH